MAFPGMRRKIALAVVAMTTGAIDNTIHTNTAVEIFNSEVEILRR
jgi:hypothetical protein